MKHYFTILAFFVFTFHNVISQDLPTETVPPIKAKVAGEAISKGNWIVGGSIGALNQNFKAEIFNLILQPSAGYFISDNFAIGTQAIIGLTIYDGGENFAYGLTPFARYYFPEGSRPSGRFFAEGRIGFAGSSIKDNNDDEVFSFLLGIGAGYAHFIADNVAIEGILSYTDTEADFGTVSVTTGLGVTIGFQIYLQGQRK